MFGFIGQQNDPSDVFFHFDDIKTPGIKPKFLKTVKDGAIIKMSYNILNYYGKYKNSNKAVNIQIIP